MQTTLILPADAPRAEPASLWARAASLLASLISLVGSPADLIRDGGTTRRERREIGMMIAPIEALVRSLLFSAAIAWLVCTSEGAAMLREARRDAATPAPPPESKACRTRAASTTHTSASCDPPAEAPEGPTPTAEGASTGRAPSDAAIAAWLAPAQLRFEPCEVMRSCIVTEKPAAAPASPRRIIRRPPPPNLKLARRIEALRHIIADPRAAMLALARDLATRDLGPLYVPSPRNWIDERWCARVAIYLARRISFMRFCFFESYRKRIDTLALPPPEPG